MKKRLFFLSLLILFPCLGISRAAMIHHWNLDETSGTSVADSVGTNDGTAAGAYDLAAIGIADTSGIDFSGGYIAASNIFTGNDARVIAFWFNTDDFPLTNTQPRLIGMGSGAAAQFDITAELFGGIPSIGVRYGNGNMAWSAVSELGGLTTDTWYHLVVQYDGTTLVADSALEVYVNGVKLTRDGGNNNNSGQVLNTTDTDFWIARDTTNTHNLDGSIDDVRVYDAPLSSQEVAALYNSYFATAVNVAPTDGQTLLPIATDGDSETDNATTLVWSAPPGYTPVGYDVYFGTEPNALNQDYDMAKIVDKQLVTSADPSPLADLVNDTQYYWFVDTYEPNTVGEILHPGSLWTFRTSPATPIFTDNTPDSLTVASGGSASFTIEALNQTSTTWYRSDDRVVGGDVNVNAGNGDTLTLTDVQEAEEGWYYAVISNGNSLQDVTSEMARLMTERLVGYWDFESGSLTDSVEGYAGAINDPNFATGLVGDGYEFFQDDRFITIVDSNDYYNFFPQGLTANIWVKCPAGVGSYNAPVCKRSSIPSNRGWAIWAQMNTESVSGTQLFGVGDIVSDSSAAANDDSWHMLTLTYNPTTAIATYYFDGEEKGTSGPAGAELDVPDVPLAFGIGNYANTGGPLAGVIDEVKIYSYDLGNKAVLGLYNTYVDPDKKLCLNPINEAVDFVDDCKIDILDFVELASSWLECGRYPIEACY